MRFLPVVSILTLLVPAVEAAAAPTPAPTPTTADRPASTQKAGRTVFLLVSDPRTLDDRKADLARLRLSDVACTQAATT